MRSTSRLSFVTASVIVILSVISCAPIYYSDAQAGTYLGFTIGVRDAPPPPRLAFYGHPRLERVDYSAVRVVEAPDPDCDLFNYQNGFYLYSGGYWYRSDRYDGPYRVVEVRRVPHAVLTVPEPHWHHPPGRDRDDHGEHRGHDEHGGDRH